MSDTRPGPTAVPPGRGWQWCLALVLLAIVPRAAAACPFCGVVGRALADRRDAAAAVAAGEPAGNARADADGHTRQPFRVLVPLRGAGLTVGAEITARVGGPVAGTALLLAGTGADVAADWEALAADETLLEYVMAAPATERPAAERLRWFAHRLEHPDRRIAADAFTEFGLAPFAAVVAAADALDGESLARWVAEPGIDQRRRGFYGLALGITAAREGDAGRRAARVAVLEAALAAPADDFRAGFDGILAGLLVAAGERGLERIAAAGLLGPTARAGDARHLLTALRFAWEEPAATLPRAATAAAVARLVDHPAVAADAVVDLARWGAWEPLDRVAALWDGPGRDDPLVRRAVAGYLAACPGDAARCHRERIAAADPATWQAASTAAGLPARRPD